MSTEFQWNDETVLEFVQFTLNNSPLLQGRYTDIKQFKESKQPKLDWEIIAYIHPDDHEYIIGLSHYGWNNAVLKNYPINSVKRLSDGEVFSIGDKVWSKQPEHPDVITEIKLGTNMEGMEGIHNPYFCVKDHTFGCYIDSINHYKEPDFFSEDGIPIYEGDKVALLSTDNWIVTFPVNAPLRPFKGDHGQFKYFSSESAANEYVLNNKPLLSLKEILSVGNTGENNPYYKKLVDIAKSKLK
jgi:hypothetical protein